MIMVNFIEGGGREHGKVRVEGNDETNRKTKSWGKKAGGVGLIVEIGFGLRAWAAARAARWCCSRGDLKGPLFTLRGKAY